MIRYAIQIPKKGGIYPILSPFSMDSKEIIAHFSDKVKRQFWENDEFPAPTIMHYFQWQSWNVKDFPYTRRNRKNIEKEMPAS